MVPRYQPSMMDSENASNAPVAATKDKNILHMKSMVEKTGSA